MGFHNGLWQLWGSFFTFLGGEIRQKLKNRKFKKPYIKVVWDSCLWDSGRWDGWGIILGWIPPFFRDIWSHKTSETLFLFVIFSILDLVQQKVNVLGTSPRNQFRDYHTWNRIEKLMPQLWNFSPQTLKTLQKTANLFSNLDFLPKSGFPKTLDLSMDFPRIFHGFPTPPSLNFRGGRGSGRQISRPGSLGQAL